MSEDKEYLLAENEKYQLEHRAVLLRMNELREYKIVLENKIDENKRKLWSLCQHIWDMDPPQYQQLTWHTCRICGNTK